MKLGFLLTRSCRPRSWIAANLVRALTCALAFFACGFGGVTLATAASKPARPNIIMIALDDQNDWVGCLREYPDVKTPHIDRLAQRGLLFTDAHAPGTVCGPSRVCVLTGILPATSGVYRNTDLPMRASLALRNVPTLTQLLKTVGYKAVMRGKVLNLTDIDAPSWDDFWPQQRKSNKIGGQRPTAPAEPEPEDDFRRQVFYTGDRPRPNDAEAARLQKLHILPVVVPPEKHRDHQTATRAIEFLANADEQPFFLAVGFSGTHTGWQASEEFYRLYPLDQIRLPKVWPKDSEDLPAGFNRNAAPHVRDEATWRQGLQTYLAAISFQDAQIGRVLEALRGTRHADNTIVILWSDQGYHLGQKQKWGKSTLWRETSRVPFIMAGPGIEPGRCDRTVSMVDVYPTLVEMLGLSRPAHLQGESLLPWIRNPNAPRDAAAITSREPGRHSVRTKQWAYIRYAGREGVGEELYDRTADPYEWHNLAGRPEHAAVQRRMASLLPQNPAPHLFPETAGKDDDAP